VLAYAVGEESFINCNNTGTYVSVQNPANNSTQCPNGDAFVALPEAWLDANENGTLDTGIEEYFDFNNNGKWDDPVSSEFIGLLCNDPLCYTAQSSLNVFINTLVITMSDSRLLVEVYPASGGTGTIDPHHYVTPDMAAFPAKAAIPVVPFGCTQEVNAFVGDTQWQIPPAGTSISMSFASGGSVVGPASDTVLDASDQHFGYHVSPFTFKAPSTPSPVPPSGTASDILLLTTVTPAPSAITVTNEFPITYTTTGACS
jgi:hypothetical protein